MAVTRRVLVQTMAAGGLAACSPLGAFDALMPPDPGTRRVCTDVPYGPHPRQRLDVYMPTWPTPPKPLVVFTYGGSWNSGSKNDYGFVGHALAGQGYPTVVYDYRLVPEVTFPAFVEDGALAVRWAEVNAPVFRADPRRILLAGHSAGAHTTAMLALDRRFLKAVGVPQTSIRGFVGLAGPYDFLPFDEDVTVAAFAAYPDPAATQPVNFARAGAPAFFLATGDADRTVAPRNTAELARRLLARKVPGVERFYRGVGHVDILLDLAPLYRKNAPVLFDIADFFRSVTA